MTQRATSSISRRHSTRLLDALDREWAQLRRRPSTLARIRSWTTSGPLDEAARSATTLDDVLIATQPGHTDGGRATDVLCELIDLAATEELAGRIVLQRVLGGLITTASRWNRHRESPTDIVIGAAWIAIRRYDTTGRRRNVAPALIADAMWIGLRRESRLKSATELPMANSVILDAPAPPVELDAITALAGTLRAAAHAGVPETEIGLIRTLAASGTPSRAAEQCQVAPRTIRNRRSVAVSSIRSALGNDWADWSDPLINAA